MHEYFLFFPTSDTELYLLELLVLTAYRDTCQVSFRTCSGFLLYSHHKSGSIVVSVHIVDTLKFYWLEK